ncbi:MAG: PP2C family protein-serine/threonine phosphatase [bacterium]|nr:PP2C family protein-serine/threonine phosphatase [Candidatus Kapabacteria bacterium]
MSDSQNGTTGIEQLQLENDELRRAVEELSVLNDLARAIGGSTDFADVIQTIVRRSARAVNAEQGLIAIVDDEEESVMKTLVRTGANSSDRHALHFTQSLLGWMQLNTRPLLMNDPPSDERFSGVRWEDSLRSLLAAPMMVRSRLTAVLVVYNSRNDGGFDAEDQRLLSIIAAQSAQVVDNARLREQERELHRIQNELQLAAAIQRNLLPKEAPKIAGYDVAGRNDAAQQVGGDLYDFIMTRDGALIATLGDVCGKGLPASLLMSNTVATLRTQAVSCSDPAQCLRVANRIIFHSTETGKFVTLVYCRLDPVTGTLEYSNGGQTKPIVFARDGTHRTLQSRGVMLGLAPDFDFESDSVHLASGDVLVAYSDGVTEAINQSGDEFGIDGVVDTVQALRTESSQDILDGLFDAVKKHSGRDIQDDDVTAVVIRRL